jgi:hypothetical protein
MRAKLLLKRWVVTGRKLSSACAVREFFLPSQLGIPQQISSRVFLAVSYRSALAASLLVSFRFAPRAQIHSVERDAEKIGRNEAELRRPEADDTNHSTIDRGQNPAFPATLAQ